MRRRVAASGSNSRVRRRDRRWPTSPGAAAPLLLVGLLLGAPALPASGQLASSGFEVDCDPELADRQEGIAPYRSRELLGRCEGTHGELRGIRLHLRAVLKTFRGFRTGDDVGPAKVRWPGAVAEPVSVRAKGTLRGQFYQMDTRVPGGFSGFEWGLEVLQDVADAAATLDEDRIHVLAKVIPRDGEVGDTVFLPVDVWRGEPEPSTCGTLRLVLWTDSRIHGLRVAVTREGGAEGAFRDLEEFSYPVSEPYFLWLPEITGPGTWRVDLEARAGQDGQGEPARAPFTYRIRVGDAYPGPCAESTR